MVLIGFAIVAGLAALSGAATSIQPLALCSGAAVAGRHLPARTCFWQLQHGSPSLEFYRNATLLKNLPSPPTENTCLNQFLFVGPILFPIWGAGLAFCVHPRPAETALPGFAYLILLTILVVSQSSRPDRIAGPLPDASRCRCGLVGRRPLDTTPVGVHRPSSWWRASRSLLSSNRGCRPRASARFAAFVGIDTQVERGEGKQRGASPMARGSVRVGGARRAGGVDLRRTLRRRRRRTARIIAPSYGHAGALELLGDLPPVLSTHNTYHMWGRERAGELVETARSSCSGWERSDIESMLRRRSKWRVCTSASIA